MGREKKFDFDKFMDIFLDTCCNVRLTCEMLGVHKSTYYDHISANPECKKIVDNVRNDVIPDEVLPEIIKKAKDGDVTCANTVLNQVSRSQNISLAKEKLKHDIALAKDKLKQDGVHFKQRFEFDNKVHHDNLEYKRERDKQMLEAELPYVNIDPANYRKMMRDRGVELPNNVNDV